MNRRYLISLLLISVLMFASMGQTSAYNIPVNLTVGDQFSIQMTKASAYEEVNGTKYSSDIPFVAGAKGDFEITSISDKDQDTIVNVTGEIGGQEINGGTTVDEWQGYLLIMLFVALFTAFFDPNNLSFDAPETTSTTTTDNALEVPPIFATSNETFYEQIESSASSTSSTSTATPDYTVNEETYTVDYNPNTKIFEYGFVWDVSDSGVNDAGQSWTYHVRIEFLVNIDVAASFVYKFHVLLKTEVTLEDASDINVLEIGWDRPSSDSVTTTSDEGGLNSLTQNLPGFGLVMAFFGLFAMNIIYRKIKR